MPLPVLNISQMREWEKAAWSAGQSEIEVIRRVGLALAQRALKLTRPGDLVLILAGSGNNGEDARFSREHLADRRVELLDVRDPATELGRLESALATKLALVIDGLFGIGLNRPLSEAWVLFIQRLNEARLQVLAVDVPSGLNADTGEHWGAAVEAAVTLTVGAPKAGLLQHSAAGFVGRLEVAGSVGLGECATRTELNWISAEDFLSYPPRREVTTHKGTYGHLAILAGSLGYHGAAVLAARGAQRAHPGLITLYTLKDVYTPVASQLQAVMVSPWVEDTRFRNDHSAYLIGPGLAAPELPENLKIAVRDLWRQAPQPVIADASALDWLPRDTPRHVGLRVITPHPGEAARALRGTVDQVQASRVRALRELSHRHGNAWVVLKGHHTLVGRSSGEVFVNSSGNPGLAQGGSGDVLAGYLAGLLAQPALRQNSGMAIRYAVWQHGATADALQSTQPQWVVEDLARDLGSVSP
jgi:NAD(P)H-hydrate epimerase